MKEDKLLKIQERIREKFVKFIRDGIYEIRSSYDGNIYCAFFLFDEGNIVMLFNGFQKKTQKTPESEIKKALELKKEYYAEKNNIGSFDAILDEKYGKIGSPEREEFHKEAYAYCVGQIVCNAREAKKNDTKRACRENRERTVFYL